MTKNFMLPADDPDDWNQRMYSEQYVLAAMLLFAHEQFEIIQPSAYVSWFSSLTELLNPLRETPGLEKMQRHGGSFWFSRKAC